MGTMGEMSPHMMRALTVASKALTLSSPNPRVGCVLVSTNGTIIGEGYTQKAGGPHAEIMALRQAQERGVSTVGATAYVTLEPCCHQGRTGPCCDALVFAGVNKVVASIADPNPLVSGQGFEKLRAAGIEVDIGSGASQSRELNIGFFSRMIRKTPWVRMKIASSIDGKTALDNGVSQWITSEPSRIDGHAWRARSCAILTGIGTVMKDNPELNLRQTDVLRQPHMVLVDSHLSVPLNARIFATNRTTYIYTATGDSSKQDSLEARGASVCSLPGHNGKVDLVAMLRDLGQHELNELHVEAGHKLNGTLLREGLVDELLIYLAPKLIGQGLGMADFGPLEELSQAVPLDFVTTDRIGPDMRIVARVSGHDRF
jgi:diaminohydroxyphosphoribosylaminopyrimidine deaminase/5-amino-6-(5-phosphoribosylamino)uracil reductase